MTTTRFSARQATGAGRPPAPPAKRPGRGGLSSLLLDIGVPLASYYLLRKAGCGQVAALALSSVVPAAQSAFALVRGRTVSGMAILVLVVNVTGLAVSFSSGDPRFMLAKDGAISSAIGIAILLSVLAGRPLMTAGMRPFIVRGDAAKDAAFGTLALTSARFRSLERRFSVVWGIACLGECAARVACAFTLPVATTVWLSTVLTLVSIGIAIVVGSFFSVPMEKMVAALAAESSQADAETLKAGS
jgi:hypothetical protein